MSKEKDHQPPLWVSNEDLLTKTWAILNELAEQTKAEKEARKAEGEAREAEREAREAELKKEKETREAELKKEKETREAERKARQAEITRISQESAARQARIDRQLEKNAQQLAILEEKVTRVCGRVGSQANNQGSATEEFFISGLSHSMFLNGIPYDQLFPRVVIEGKNGTQLGEFDMVLLNGKSVAFIEVKYRMQPSDVDKVVNQQIDQFRNLLPHFKDRKLYAGVAAMSYHPEALEKAREAGLIVLRQRGQVIEELNPQVHPC